ncbi:hypothetical protein IOMTU133_0402 [Pseudomonas aeruginosa]|nr:hypothetical protein IOMTU133_0402 [Pseudomonas aeruginosa]
MLNHRAFRKDCQVCIPVMLTPNSNDCDPAALKVLTRSFQ